MLSKKQLHDAFHCTSIGHCMDCAAWDKSTEQLPTCVERAAKTALKGISMLERHVWHKRSSDGKFFCIECRNLKENGHTKDCELQAMLKES
jgi:hypothetical protein